METYAIDYLRVWEFVGWGVSIGIAKAFCWWSFGKLLGLWLRWLERIGSVD